MAHDAAVVSVGSLTEMKARQAAKMREIREALVADGFAGLDKQAAALGLPRSTTWTIIKGNHKSSGLSAAILARMLSAADLRPHVRSKILEYIEEKSAGHYGGSKVRLRKFIDQMNWRPASLLGASSKNGRGSAH